MHVFGSCLLCWTVVITIPVMFLLGMLFQTALINR
jgi:hypothetical protein